jgi:glucose/arabinose dehydrogenase
MGRRLAWVVISALLTGACASGGGQANAPLRMPLKVPVAGAPNGVEVRDTDGAIFITDDASSGVAFTPDITDASPSFSDFARIPAEGLRTSLSELAFAPNGHLLVERFGFGTSSAVFDVAPNGQVALASGTNPARRRLGLLVLDGGTYLSSWFSKEGEDAPASGGVSMITRGETPGSVVERDLVTGLGKPVGLAKVGDTLFISDQAANRIARVDLLEARTANAPIGASETFATVDAPDLLAAMPDGRLYTKCGAHGVCSFSKRGRATVIADDLDQPRGVAVDAARKRLVVVDRGGRGKASYLRVLPIR